MRGRSASVIGLCAVAAGLLSLSGAPEAQTYSSGQNASPAFEGWERNADGSFNLLFGYMNRNWDEELFVPIGPDNNIEPGGPDRGQPTRLLPRYNRFVFRVQVPKDWGDREVVWTLTTKGKTEKAYASLRQDYFIDDVVIASETGALGAGSSSPEVRANKRPQIKVEGAKKRSVKVGEPLTLTTWVGDDGIPKPRSAASAAAAARALALLSNASPNAPRNPAYNPPSRLTVNKRTGLHMMWFVYRGEGRARFEPMQIKSWEDTRTGANSPWAPLWTPPPVPKDGMYTATVTFDAPGTYVLRARADDGALFADDELTVTVTP
jgi:autonomous glycyl radical cofactor GrcA